MPKAEDHGPNIKEHVNSLGEKLKTLRLRLRRCVSSRPALSLAGGSLSSGLFQKHPAQTRFPPGDTKTQAGRRFSLRPGTEAASLAHFSLSRGWGGR